MKTFCAVDPGKKQCGFAQFMDGQLSLARLITPDVYATLGGARLVIEVPRIYPIAQQKGDQNDLIDVAFEAGRCAARFLEVTRFYPHQWKGNMPKAKMTARIESRLTPAELETVETYGHLRHNVLDAVGIGLFVLGRL